MMRRLNFIGTLITDTELPLGEDGYCGWMKMIMKLQVFDC